MQHKRDYTPGNTCNTRVITYTHATQVVVTGPFILFFASQSLHNGKKIKKKSGDVNDEVKFPPFFFAS
jgi:hypothetical protein